MRSAEMPLLGNPGDPGTRISFRELARRHILDWIAVLFLCCVFYVFHVLHPFRRFVGRSTMDGLRYPINDSTVSFVYVPVLALGAPAAAFLCFYAYRRDLRDLHCSLLGLAFSIALAGAVTNALKVGVGRPRPDFFWRCFPDGNDVYAENGEVLCTGDEAVIIDGHRSFPSGHASWCFSGLGYLSLYCAGRIHLFDRGQEQQLWTVLVPLAPLALASYVGITRVDDYKHHWEDVVVAALIGMTIAAFCYQQHFRSDCNIQQNKTSPPSTPGCSNV